MTSMAGHNLIDRVTVESSKTGEGISPNVFVSCINLDDLLKDFTDRLIRDHDLPVIVSDDEVPIMNHHISDLDRFANREGFSAKSRIRRKGSRPINGKFFSIEKGGPNLFNIGFGSLLSQGLLQRAEGTRIKRLIAKIAVNLMGVTSGSINHCTHGTIREREGRQEPSPDATQLLFVFLKG